MSAHNRIVVSPRPQGHFGEGVMVSGAGAFYPGQICSIDSTADLIDGRPQYKLWDGAADGERSSIIIVRENFLLGKTVDDAYAAGSRFFFYIPLPGDEVQVLLADVAGTGTDLSERPALGTKLIIDDTTGKVLVTTGSPEIEPFEVMELLDEPIAADTLILCRYTGH